MILIGLNTKENKLDEEIEKAEVLYNEDSKLDDAREALNNLRMKYFE